MINKNTLNTNKEATTILKEKKSTSENISKLNSYSNRPLFSFIPSIESLIEQWVDKERMK